jgi:hypothetical protein
LELTVCSPKEVKNPLTEQLPMIAEAMIAARRSLLRPAPRLKGDFGGSFLISPEKSG